jgi:transcriptional regulator with PAS, ATPase and Fis domain
MSQTLNADTEYRRSCRKYLEDMIACRDFAAACRYFDSIQNIWSGKSDIESGIILRLGAKAFGSSGNLSRALTLIRTAIAILSKAVGETMELAECYIDLGDVLREMGKFREAEAAFRDAESIFRRNDSFSQAGVALNRLAAINFRRGELDNSLKCLLEAIEYAKKADDKKKIAYIFGNIGRVYTLLGKLNAARENLELNVGLSGELGDEIEVAKAYLSLGYIDIQQSRFDKAEKVLTSALEYIRRNNMEKEEIIYLTYSGELMLKTSRYKEAESMLNQAINRANKISPESLLASRPIRQLAELAILQKNFRKALLMANKAMISMKQLDDSVEIGALRRIKAICLENLNQKKKAEKAFIDSIATLEECKAKVELADALAEAGKSTIFNSYQRTMYLCRAEELYTFCDIPPRVIEIQKVIGSLEVITRSGSGHVLSSKMATVDSDTDDFPTWNPKIKKIIQHLRLLKDTDIPILLTGETGTGKDHLAKYFHSITRPNGPYIAVNLAAVPETLIESELFGYHRGAFTGAEANRRGLFLSANNGVLLLDEIGELPLMLQAKLLNILETKKLRPLGTSTEIDLDVFIVAATNRNLYDMVGEGTFRRDLYYRLACITIELPPLRERKEDIPYLLDYFMRQHELLNGKSKPEPELIRQFVGYDWPGNIRQLENKIKQLSVMASLARDGSIVELSQSFFSDKKEEESGSLTEQVEQFEKQLLLEALISSGGNKSEAARLLSIHESTFRAKMKRYGLSAAVA